MGVVLVPIVERLAERVFEICFVDVVFANEVPIDHAGEIHFRSVRHSPSAERTRWQPHQKLKINETDRGLPAQ